VAKTLTLPSMLNYTRSIIPSNGVFFYTENGQEKPVEVYQQTVRGTIASFSGVPRDVKKSVDETDAKEISAKLLDPTNANIQRIDVCYLPNTVDRFHLRFSVTFAPHSLASGACGDAVYAEHLAEFAQTYRSKGGYRTVAQRYLQNLINARWLWRNRYATDKQVSVSMHGAEQPFVFTVANDFEHDYSQCDGYAILLQAITDALSGEGAVLRLNVLGSGVLGMGQEVYPSQEFVEGKKDKTLASVTVSGNTRQAAMHSQKIGNALRTIDDWHSRAAQYGKLAVEPFGVVAHRAEAARLPSSGSDLYTYLMDLEAALAALQQATEGNIPDHLHYVMACLIRGGVFSGEGKEKKAKKGA
jgi:CRISPR-associated protein Csy3